jgi:Rab-GTPase-TBC domain
MNALQVFSVYNEKVGYCQSMNFVFGFIMMINGGNEKEAFWLFAGLAKTSSILSTDEHRQPIFEGLRGFYKKHFPLLQQYFY